MRKNLWKSIVLPGLAVLAASVAVSCQEGPDGGDTQKDEHGNTFVVTQTITPLRYTDSKYYAGREGVSIEVTSAQTKNLVFVCKPGADVMSYRVNVYPVSSLNNFLLNWMNDSKLQKLTVEQGEELIANIINNTESVTSGGKLISREAMGDEYDNMEFDWMNSSYASFPVQPNSEYLIICQAYFDEAGKELPADLCICHAVTPQEELIGEPAVMADVNTGFFSYNVMFRPNEDAYGFYFLASPADQIDQYIDAYGEKMYSEFLRHYGDLATDEFPVSAKEQPVKDAQGNLITYVATAIAVDKNMTPAKDVNRYDFTLKEMPTDAKVAEGKVEAPYKVAATICQFKLRLENSALRLAYYVYEAAQADDIMAKEEAVRKQMAQKMVSGLGSENDSPGWIVVNKYYGIDTDKNELTGDPLEGEGFQHELLPQKDYKIIYALMNGYGQASDLFVTDKFTTKPLVKDRPEDSKEDATMKITSATRTAFNLQATFKRENTARIYWQYYYPDNPGAGYNLPDPEDIIKANPDKYPGGFEAWDPAGMDARMGTGKYTEKSSWIYWFLVWRDPGYKFPWPNEIYYDEFLQPNSEGFIEDNFGMDGFKPGQHTYFAYLVEDWDGVLGPVKFFDGSTQEIIGGDNPQASITPDTSTPGMIKFRYQANEETREMRYAIQTNLSDGASLLLLNYLVEDDFGGLSYDEFIKAFDKYIMGYGLPSSNIDLTQEFEIAGNYKIAVSLVKPVGGKDAGNPVYGPLQALIYVKETGEFKTLAEYMGVDKK